jgi:hypothetical protein
LAHSFFFSERKIVEKEGIPMKQGIQKLMNHSIMSQNPELYPHLPVTKRLTRQSMQQMLNLSPHLYLKPNNSCQGKGIMRIDRLAKQRFQLQTRDNNKRYTCSTQRALYRLIQEHKRKRPYIVQQGIESRTIDGRLYDIRVHLTRVDDKWHVVGMIGRIAPRKGIATNAYSGGIPVNIDHLLRQHLQLSRFEQKRTLSQLANLSLLATHVISEHFPKWAEYGLDIGRDRWGHLWIYEINIHPGLYVFRFEKELQQRLQYLRTIAQ